MNRVQWKMFACLIRRYSQLRFAMEQMLLLYPKSSELKKLQQGLQQGKSLKELLKKNRFEKQIGFYSDFMNSEEAIELVLLKEEKKEKQLKVLADRLGYPLLITFISCVSLSVFTHSILPQIVSQLALPASKTAGLLKGFSLINTLKNIVLVFCALLSGAMVLIVGFKKENILWVVLHRFHSDSLILQKASGQFAEELLLLLNRGISIDRAVASIRFADKPLISLLAYHLNEGLEEGKELKECLKYELFDPRFYECCLYGLSKDSFIEALNDYVMIYELQKEKRLACAAAVMQCLGYLLGATIIIMGYEVMMLPLEILEGL